MRLTMASAAIAALSVSLPVSAGTLETVKARGSLICGSNPGLPGLGVRDAAGEWSGLDVDYCRAIAAAIFGDPGRVNFVPLDATVRFEALRDGSVDVLIRNSTWTMSRDIELGLTFVAVNYYDGQGFMVRKGLGISSALELDGATVCAQKNTTTELNLADFFRLNGKQYTAITFNTFDATQKAYAAENCDAITADATGLHAARQTLSVPDDHLILPEIISKEPLSAVVREGDDQWADVVRWTHYAMVGAEELGITQDNLDMMLKSERPEVRRFVGTEGDFGTPLGLSADWAVRIVRAVGNYGESFERNVGMGSPLKIARGLNALWSQGGLQYAPPFR